MNPLDTMMKDFFMMETAVTQVDQEIKSLSYKFELTEKKVVNELETQVLKHTQDIKFLIAAC